MKRKAIKFKIFFISCKVNPFLVHVTNILQSACSKIISVILRKFYLKLGWFFANDMHFMLECSELPGSGTLACAPAYNTNIAEIRNATQGSFIIFKK
jgi:hypothetical protein